MQSETEAKAPLNVWVLSFSNVGNFGDRLGVQLMHQALPPHAIVKHIHHRPMEIPAGEPDVLIVGIGNSIFGDLLTDEFDRLLARAPKVVGVFGTQYREAIPPQRWAHFMSRLDLWFARTSDDAETFGGLARETHVLGDWLMDAFPMTTPTINEAMTVGGALGVNQPLDRYIAYLQSYRRVHSRLMHPLLCAMCSAETVSYSEQPIDFRQGDIVRPILTGKFARVLRDIVGKAPPPETPFTVDRGAVISYKARVRANIEAMRARLATLLDEQPQREPAAAP